jgi:hypothetical protein
MRPILLSLLAMPASASAFCGVYVAGEGNEVTNHASQVIIAHHGDHTTLTIAADAGGNADDFGLLIPLPGDVDQEDITLADPQLFALLDQYSSPREVEYTCDTVRGSYVDSEGCEMGLGCAEYSMTMAADGGGPGDDVQVDDLFTVGEYEIAIVHASEAGAMQGWLDGHGFVAPDDPDGVLQRYLDGGNRFMATRVMLDALPAGQEWLHPLQFRFAQGDDLRLPIEIGTISAHGARQDVVLYVFTDLDQGDVRITNYPEVTPEDECMRPDGSDLTAFYDGLLDDALGDGAGWVREYGITADYGYHCDPCTSPRIGPEELPLVGWDGDVMTGARLNRLHVRYAADQLNGDLEIAIDGKPSEEALSQMRYIEYNPDLEYLYPICGEGFAEDPGECPDEGAELACSVPGVGAPPIAGVLLALAGALRRRRA